MAWKLLISLPPFLLRATRWGCWRKGSPPSHLLYFSSSRIVEFTSITPFIHTLPDVPYPDCRICWFTFKDCAKLNKKPLSGSSFCNQELILLNQSCSQLSVPTVALKSPLYFCFITRISLIQELDSCEWKWSCWNIWIAFLHYWWLFIPCQCCLALSVPCQFEICFYPHFAKKNPSNQSSSQQAHISQRKNKLQTTAGWSLLFSKDTSFFVFFIKKHF